MIVGESGALPLTWLAEPLAQALSTHRGHALLVHGSPGVGAMAFAFTLAQAWLCEADGAAARPCGRCGSCRLIQSHLHPDLTVLMPETLRREHGWPLPEDRTDGDEGKRKPSKQIRINEVRLLIERSTRTSARGRGKVGLLHPADVLNTPSANALLKTLEEPAPGTRLLLTTSDPASLLPTVRSRCQLLRLPAPATDMALAWLQGQGVRFSLSSWDGTTLTPITIGATDSDGILRFTRLQPGIYDLQEVDAAWCHAESDNVNADGRVVVEDGRLVLTLPADLEALDGERLQRRFAALAGLLDSTAEIRRGG